MKALKGIDFGAIAMNTVGMAVGLAAATQANRIPFVAKMENPKIKGTVLFLMGKVGVPVLAKMAGITGKKSSEVVKGTGDGMAAVGLSQLGNAVAPNIFPKISGVEGIDGYETSPYRGLGLVTDEDEVTGIGDASPTRSLE